MRCRGVHEPVARYTIINARKCHGCHQPHQNHDVLEVPCSSSQHHVQIVRWFTLVVAGCLRHRSVYVPLLQIHTRLDRTCTLFQTDSISPSRVVIFGIYPQFYRRCNGVCLDHNQGVVSVARDKHSCVPHLSRGSAHQRESNANPVAP